MKLFSRNRGNVAIVPNFQHPPSSRSKGSTTGQLDEGRTASDRYLRQIEARLNVDEQFLRELHQSPRAF
jgi:hypothetical protein